MGRLDSGLQMSDYKQGIMSYLAIIEHGNKMLEHGYTLP